MGTWDTPPTEAELRGDTGTPGTWDPPPTEEELRQAQAPAAPKPKTPEQLELDQDEHLKWLHDLASDKSVDDHAAIRQIVDRTGADPSLVEKDLPGFRAALDVGEFNPREWRQGHQDLYRTFEKSPEMLGAVTRDKPLSAAKRALDWASRHHLFDTPTSQYTDQLPWAVAMGAESMLEASNLLLAVPGLVVNLAREPEAEAPPEQETVRPLSPEVAPPGVGAIALDRLHRHIKQAELAHLQTKQMMLDQQAASAIERERAGRVVVGELHGYDAALAERSLQEAAAAWENRKATMRLTTELGPEPDYGVGELGRMALDLADFAGGMAPFVVAHKAGNVVGGGLGLAGGAVAARVTKRPELIGAGARLGWNLGGHGGGLIAGFDQMAGPEYARLVDEGLRPEVAGPAAAFYGIVASAGLEAMVGPALSKLGVAPGPGATARLAGSPMGREFLLALGKRWAEGSARGGVGMAFMEAERYITEWAARSVNERGLQPFPIQEARRAVNEAGVAGTAGMALTFGVLGVGSDLTHAAIGEHRAKVAARQVQAAAKLAKSPLTKSNLVEIAVSVQAQTRGEGYPIESMWVDPKALVEHAAEMGLGTDELATQLMGPKGPGRLQEALAGRVDIHGQRASLEVPLTEWILHWTEGDIIEKIKEDTTTDRGLATAREMDARDKAEQESSQGRIDQLIKETQESGAWVPASPEARALADAVETSLTRTGKYKPEEIEHHMILARVAAEKLAERLGKPVEDAQRLLAVQFQKATPAEMAEATRAVAARAEAETTSTTSTPTREAQRAAWEAMTPEAKGELYYRDIATGLLNERGDAARPPDPARPFVAVFSTEGLKPANDVYGHVAGTGLLKTMAAVVKTAIPDASMRGTDVKGDFASPEAARKVADAMEKALDPGGKIKVTVTSAPREAALADLGPAHDAAKDARLAAGEIGHRKGAPAELLRGQPEIDYEGTGKGLALESPEAQAILGKAWEAMAPMAEAWKGAKEGEPVALSEQHRKAFAGTDAEQAFETIHQKASGALTGDGWELARKLAPKAFVTTSDMRGIRDMNQVFGKEPVNEILQVFNRFMMRLGGGEHDLAHPHGDENLAQSNDRAALEQFFERAKGQLQRLVFYDIRKNRTVAIQDGVYFEHGTDTERDAAERDLTKRKRQQQGVVGPRVVGLEEFYRFAAEVRRTHGDHVLVGVGDLVAGRRAEAAGEARRGSADRAIDRLVTAVAKAKTPEAVTKALKNPRSPIANHFASVEAIRQDLKQKRLLEKPQTDWSRAKIAETKWTAYRDSLAESGLGDSHPSEKQDAVYIKWVQDGRKGPHPEPYPGGLFQGLDDSLTKPRGLPRISCAAEAYDLLTKGKRDWKTIGEAIEKLRGVDGYSDLHLPQAVSDRMAEEREAERPEGEEPQVDDEGNLIDPKTGNVLFQPAGPAGGPPRGWVKINADGIKKAAAIFVTDHADVSTPLHELAHVYFETLADLAEAADTPADLKADFGRALEWLGVRDRASLTDKQREDWARGFEAYLMEGKAPSLELASTFTRFRVWLTDLYRDIRSLSVHLDDNIRGVFDRLLATETEIEVARKGMGADLRLFKNRKSSGMTEPEWQAYQAKVDEGTARADLRLRREEAQMRAREASKGWKAEVRKAEDQAEEEYNARPDVRADQYIRRGIVTDEQGKPVDGAFAGQLHLGQVRAILGHADKALETKLKGRLAKGAVEEAEHPDTVAQRFGFKTGKEMLEALLAVPERDATVRARGEELARQAHPELGTKAEELERQVNDALHDEGTSDALIMEGERMARQGNLPGLPDKRLIQRAAEQLAERQLVSKLRPTDAIAKELAAARHATAAFARGDFRTAARLKQDQILNHAMYRELTQARRDRDALVDLAASLSTQKSRVRLGKGGPAYRDVVDSLLEALQFVAPIPQEPGVTRADLGALFATMEANGDTVMFNVETIAKALAKPGAWQNLTVREARDVLDALRNITASARGSSTALVDGKRVDKQEIVDGLIREAEANLPKLPDIPTSVAEMTLAERAASKAAGLHANVLRPGTMIGWLSGKDTSSLWHRAVFKPLRDAAGAQADILKKAFEPVISAFEAIPPKVRSRLMETIDGKKLFPAHVAGMAPPMRRVSLLMMALFRGCKSNIERLTDGRGITLEQVDNAISMLSREELEWVQSVWDAHEGLWPLSRALEERDAGVAPPKLELQPFTARTEGGGTIDMQGGYFAAIYDKRMTDVGQRQALNSIASLMDPSYTRPGTARSHLKARAQQFAEVLALDPGAIRAGLAQVAHDLAFREALKSVGGLILDPGVQRALQQHLGPERAEMFLPWLRDIGQMRGPQMSSQARAMTSLFRKLRSNAMVGILGYRVPVAMGDLAGALVAAPRLRQHWAMGWADVLRAPFEMRAFAVKHSPWIRSRDRAFDSELQAVTSKLTRRGGRVGDAYAAFLRHAWDIFDWTEQLTTTPMWLGAYRKALADGKVEADAAYDADNFCDRFFPAANVVNRAAMLRDQGAVGTSLMFQGYMNTVMNENLDAAHDLRQAWYRGESTPGKVFSVAIALPAVAAQTIAFLSVSNAMSELLTGRGPEDGDRDELDPENDLAMWANWYLRKLLMGVVGPIPWVGGAFESLLIGKQPSIRNAPAFAVIDELGKSALTALKDTDDEDRARKRMTKAIKAAAIGAGIPVSPATPVDYLFGETGWSEDVEQGDIPGIVEGITYGNREGKPATPLTPLVQP